MLITLAVIAVATAWIIGFIFSVAGIVVSIIRGDGEVTIVLTVAFAILVLGAIIALK